MTPAQVTQFRSNLSHLGITPHGLARRQRPVAFVDLVYGGRTYENLFYLLRRWISEERAAWSVIRTKVRFIGITARTKTSPNTWCWSQAAPWATAYGRSPEGRAGLAAAITGEPTMRQPWVRSLVNELRRPITTRQT
ncbi:hypothetical protein JNW90_00060 [Micromonospora sp. STR1s_5]|nr:hypothetical protein [Micromonospora sp. STR1s_5]